MKSNDVSNVLTGIIALCCLVLTGTALQRQLSGPKVNTVLAVPEQVSDWASYARDGHRMGPASARVVITEFSDYQCPFCRKFNDVIHELREAYPNDVAVIYRHLPLPQHRQSWMGALAGECAAAQGRFAAFTDAVMKGQDSIGARPWTSFARAAGVTDTAAFVACLRDSTYNARVKRDETEGKRLKARGTPTVLVNSWRLKGALTFNNVDKVVRQELGLPAR